MHILVIGDIHIGKDKLIGVFQYDQAKALAAAGLRVTYFAIDLRSIRRKRHLGYTHGVSDNVEWHLLSLPVGNVPSWLFDKAGIIALKWLYNKVFSQNQRPDVIHAHFLDKGVIASRLAKIVHIPLVITEHSSAMNRPEIEKDTLRRAKEAYFGADSLICVSSELANNLERLVGVKGTVIPNIIDVETFAKSCRMEHSGFHLVTAAGLIPQKRIGRLLQAMVNVRDIPDIFLEVIGDGPLMGELESFSIENKISDKVRFHGQLTREQIAKVFETCDCFVMPSARETFGVVYVEAMAAGLPVIATRCGGPEDFVDDSNGILIDVDNQEQLDNAIRNMYQTAKNKYDSEAIKRYASERFSPMIVAEQLIENYKSVLKKNS